MKLDVAIQKVINDFGIEILKESRFVNLLDDYQAFEDMPYAKNILKQIYAENYGAHILNAVQTCDINKANELIAHISSNVGFDEGRLSLLITQKTMAYQKTRQRMRNLQNYEINC